MVFSIGVDGPQQPADSFPQSAQEIRELRQQIRKCLPSWIRRDSVNCEDVISEVITQAMASFDPLMSTPWKWCSLIASRRGASIWHAVTGRDSDPENRILLTDFNEEDMSGVLASLQECMLSRGIAYMANEQRDLPRTFDFVFTSADKQSRFWTYVAEGRTPSDAAREVGVSRESANYYKKRARRILAPHYEWAA